MRTISVLLVALFAWTCGSSPAAAAVPGKPIYTNKTRFRIPYNYDPLELRKLGAREIRLYASTDRGVQWRQIQSVAPDVGRFNFQAPGEGEYWFSVRTLDGENKLHPGDAEVQPGLQVIVDTTPPRLEVGLRQLAPGRVQLGWNAIDENLDTSKLRLEFLQDGESNWQVVGVIPKSAGQTEWTVPQGGLVAVRGTIGDAAGNIGQAQAKVQVAAGSDLTPKPAIPDFRDPIAGSGLQQTGNPSLTMAERFPSAVVVPRDSSLVQPFVPGMPLEPGASIPMATSPAENQPLHNASSSQFSPRPGDFGGERLVGDQALSPRKIDGRLRVVNTRQFHIGYKIQDVGPSGVSGIELYATQDNGASWFRYGEDADHQSPFRVEVPREGTYGFALLVRSGAGLASDPPQPGDQPSIVVMVDETPPEVQMLPLEQGRGGSINKLMISWKVRDAFPADKPISLYFSANRNGPWQPISGPIDDSGSFVWTMGPGVPSKFHIRVEVRDAAGNTSTIETPQPVLVDLSRPTARIVDIETGGAPQ